LNCIWCHNPEGKNCEIEKAVRINKISEREFKIEELIGREVGVRDVMDEVERDMIVFEESGGGVTFSGGEPMYQVNFLKELLIESKKKNIHTTVDTSGYTSKNNLDEIINYVDLFLYDIKHFEDSEHIKYTGRSNVTILENLEYLINKGKKVILRIPVVPGINFTASNINLLKEYLTMHMGKIQEIGLLPFHNIADNKYDKMKLNNPLKEVKSLNEEDLFPLKNELESLGVIVKIGG
jgi:pyruvate formate lyase activating enzyme